MKNGFSRGKVDNTLFTLHKNDELILVQIYVDDIIFSATSESLCDKFSKLMQKMFEFSMMGELNCRVNTHAKRGLNSVVKVALYFL